MKVTNKDDLRVGDEARFVHGKSALQGPIRALTQGADGGPIISVTIEGFEHSITIHDHAARGGWLWAFDGGERPVPEPEVGQTGTARINYLEIETAGSRGTWVLRSDGGDELVFAVHRPVGSIVRVPRSAVSNFQPDPDWKAAVDAYVQAQHDLRQKVDEVEMPAAARRELHWTLDQVQDVSGWSPPAISHHRLVDVIRQILDTPRGKVGPGAIAKAVEILLAKDLGIEVAQ